jgi:hypothetical protein
MREAQYELDREDRIRSINTAWSAFARENDAEDLIDAILGTSIWDWIAGVEVRHLYSLLFSRVRKTHGPMRIPFRCDSPSVRRFMELEMWHSAMVDCAAVHSSSAELLAICSWCKRVRADRGQWLEIEDAASRLDLLEDPPPALTHTICPDCEDHFDDLE